jgi:hypothetical protein
VTSFMFAAHQPVAARAWPASDSIRGLGLPLTEAEASQFAARLIDARSEAQFDHLLGAILTHAAARSGGSPFPASARSAAGPRRHRPGRQRRAASTMPRKDHSKRDSTNTHITTDSQDVNAARGLDNVVIPTAIGQGARVPTRRRPLGGTHRSDGRSGQHANGCLRRPVSLGNCQHCNKVFHIDEGTVAYRFGYSTPLDSESSANLYICAVNHGIDENVPLR